MKWLSRWGRRFGLARGLALLLLLALAALRIFDPLPIQELRVRVFDLFQVLQPREATERPVVIIDIDEQSLRSVGQWPWPRTRIADLISRLTQMGALVLGADTIAYLQAGAVQAMLLYMALFVGLVSGYAGIRTAAQIAKRKAA